MPWKSGLHPCRREGCPGWATAKSDYCHQLCEAVSKTLTTLKGLAGNPDLTDPKREAASEQWDALEKISVSLDEFAQAFDQYKKAYK